MTITKQRVTCGVCLMPRMTMIHAAVMCGQSAGCGHRAEMMGKSAMNENCVRCGQPESERHHKSETSRTEGWHPFRGQDYIDALEDALLFVRENKQRHAWRSTGIVIDTFRSFTEKVCGICGAINWGGKEDGVCFGEAGKQGAESALNAAHNRRVFKKWLEGSR